MARLRPLWSVTLADYAAAIQWSPDGQQLGAATVAGTAVFLDAKSGSLVWEADRSPEGVLSVAFCPTAPLVAMGTQDGMLAIHEVGSGAPRSQRASGGTWLAQLAWADDGHTLASASGRSVGLWSREHEPLPGSFQAPSTITALRWHSSTRRWGAASYGVLSFIARDAPSTTQLYFRSSLLTLDASPDGRFIACGTQDPLVHVWDLANETNEINLTGYPGKTTSIAWSPHTPVLATAGGPEVIVWDFAGGNPFGAPPRQLRVSNSPVSALAFLPDGTLLAATADGSLAVINPTMDEQPVIVDRLGEAIHALLPSPDGSLVAASASRGLVRVYAVEPTAV